MAGVDKISMGSWIGLGKGGQDVQKISEVELPTISPTIKLQPKGRPSVKPQNWMRERLGFGEEAATKTFDSFDRSRQPAAYDVAVGFDLNPHRNKSLVFWGLNGVGKTHLALAIGNAILERRGTANIPVLFVIFDEALDRIKSTFENGYEGHGEWHYIERWTTIPVLILDEVGQEGRDKPPGDGDFTRRIGYRIIDGRYRNGLPIILTTNKSPNELCEWITQSAVDRLMEMGAFIKMGGKSWRQDRRRTSSSTKSG